MSFAILVVTSLLYAASVSMLVRIDHRLSFVRVTDEEDTQDLSGEISGLLTVQGRRFDKEIEQIHERMGGVDQQLDRMNAVLGFLVELVERRLDAAAELAGRNPGAEAAGQSADHDQRGGGTSRRRIDFPVGQQRREGPLPRQRNQQSEVRHQVGEEGSQRQRDRVEAADTRTRKGTL